MLEKTVPGEVCYPGTIAQNGCVGTEAGARLGRRQQAHSWSMLHGGVGFVLLAREKQLEQEALHAQGFGSGR